MADADRRDIIISFRATPAEAAHLDAAGKALSLPRQRADFCRAAALHFAKSRVPEPPKAIRRPGRRKPTLDVELLAKILAQVSTVAGNVDKLIDAIREDGGLPPPVLARLSMDVIQIRDAVRVALDGGDRHGNGLEGNHGH
jgi:hypothetical protein